MKQFTWFALFTCALVLTASAQTKPSIDKIVAIVGDHVILQSEVTQVYAEYLQNDPTASDTILCGILQSLLTRDLMCEQAQRDSITVSDDEVEGSLDNKVRYFAAQYGGEQQMETVLGKSITQIKDEYRRLFRDQLLAQRMQSQIMANVHISPTEVRSFFDKIPKDSLPIYPSMVEVGQIVLTPVASQEVETYAREQLEDTRAQIIAGKIDFETAAAMISQDGSKNNGGDLGMVTRDEMVPEFTSAAFRLQNGEISNVVKSRFGFHIIQMVRRLGEKAQLRHILVKPQITSSDLSVASKRADSILGILQQKKMSFVEAVAKFSTDEQTRSTGGMFTDASTGGSLLSIDALEPDVALAIANMKPGDLSAPMIYTDPRTGDQLVRILYLKTITEPHVADLKLDYSKIQEAALQEKQNIYLQNWVGEHIGQFYIYIHPDYILCNDLSDWVKYTRK